MLSLLLIGDMHAGKGNIHHVKSLLDTLQGYLDSAIAKNMNVPHAIIFMGDLFDKFENIYLPALRLITKHLISFSKHLNIIVIVGNHDRVNPTDFQTDMHPFTALSGYERITIVDKAKHMVFKSNTSEGLQERYRLVFVPYVEPGRFHEALDTLPISIKDDPPAVIFCHQEFYGVHLGGSKKSEKGDKWDTNLPIIFSGHIHNYHELQTNLIYVGTPYQITYSEDHDKAIINVRLEVKYENNKLMYMPPVMKRMHFGITDKMIVRIVEDEVAKFIEDHKMVRNKDQVKIYLYGMTTAIPHNAISILNHSGFMTIVARPAKQSPTLKKASNVTKQSIKDIWFDLLKDDDYAMDMLSSLM